VRGPLSFFLKGKWRVFRRFIELEGNYSSVQTEKRRNQEQRKMGKKKDTKVKKDTERATQVNTIRCLRPVNLWREHAKLR
jgi:hypothetical protein